jgi:hypothetical protein
MESGLGFDNLEYIFSFLSPNCITLSVKPLNRHFKQWVEHNYGSDSKKVSAGSHVPTWALLALRTDHLSSEQQQLLKVLAAKGGQLYLLKWFSKGKPLDAEVSDAAAEGGDIATLEWLKQQGFLWPASICAAAAKGGHKHVLMWALEKGFKLDANCCAASAEGGHLEVLQWLRSLRCPWRLWEVQNAAIRGGSVAVLQWLQDQEGRFQKNPSDWSQAASRGHLEALQWAEVNKYPLPDNLCSVAARVGDLAMLKWGKSVGVPVNSFVMYTAVVYGQVHVLQWLIEQGCPKDALTCEAIKVSSNPKVHEWHRASSITSSQQNTTAQCSTQASLPPSDPPRSSSGFLPPNTKMLTAQLTESGAAAAADEQLTESGAAAADDEQSTESGAAAADDEQSTESGAAADDDEQSTESGAAAANVSCCSGDGDVALREPLLESGATVADDRCLGGHGVAVHIWFILIALATWLLWIWHVYL